ncbi:enoyl-CoA hydratase/isomerase family protein [Planosporangium sp. 12N6]|uniref:enoyl-CoA hydratase/isomerase family protein n=1 Tax=Planosporangium spinosum TaxID=3402278 RepID=UPI003CF79BC6
MAPNTVPPDATPPAAGRPGAAPGPRDAAAAGPRGPVVEVDLTDGVAHVRLNRPDARNALDAAMAAGLRDAARRCAEADGLRAVLISGAGPVLTVGGDIAVFASATDRRRPGLMRDMAALYHEALQGFLRLDAPIVCAAHGAVAGGGLGLLYVADLVLAAEGTRFALGYAALGLSSDAGSSWFLPRLVGPKRAAELYFEQRVLNAHEATEWGLVSRVVPADALPEEALAVARRLAAGPTRAYAEMRHLLNDSGNQSLSDHLAAEERAMYRTAATVDAAEGIAAFAGKREPHYQGW